MWQISYPPVNGASLGSYLVKMGFFVKKGENRLYTISMLLYGIVPPGERSIKYVVTISENKTLKCQKKHHLPCHFFFLENRQTNTGLDRELTI